MFNEDIFAFAAQVIGQLIQADDIAVEVASESMVRKNPALEYVRVHPSNDLIAVVDLLGIGGIKNDNHVIVIIKTLFPRQTTCRIQGEAVVEGHGVAQ